MGLRLRCRNKSSFLHDWSQKRHQDPKMHGKFGQMWRWCWLFWLWRLIDHYEFFPRGVWPRGKNSTKSTTLKWLIVCERQWDEKEARFVEGEKMDDPPRQRPRIFATFSQSTRQHSSHNLRTRQILHQQTSFCSRSGNSHWKIVFSPLITSKKVRWRSCPLFHIKHSSNASKTVKKKKDGCGVLGVNYFEEDKTE